MPEIIQDADGETCFQDADGETFFLDADGDIVDCGAPSGERKFYGFTLLLWN